LKAIDRSCLNPSPPRIRNPISGIGNLFQKLAAVKRINNDGCAGYERKCIYPYSPQPFERELSGIRKFEPISRLHDGLVDILQVGRNDQSGYFYCVMELADDASQRGVKLHSFWDAFLAHPPN
jgi:hypothetical protein